MSTRDEPLGQPNIPPGARQSASTDTPPESLSAGQHRASRNTERGYLAGVAQGIADHLNTSVTIVRGLFVLSTMVNGSGLIAYLLAWVFLPTHRSPHLHPKQHPQFSQPAPPTQPGQAGRAASLSLRWAQASWPHPRTLVLSAVLILALLWSISLRHSLANMWGMESGPLLISLVLFAVVASIWIVADAVGPRYSTWVYLLGSFLALVGIAVIVRTEIGIAAAVWGFIAAVVVIASMLIMLAPWLQERWRASRAQGIALARQQEREQLASAVHDSVMQTLTLIQKNANDPARVQSLARGEEQALRSWLYGSPDQQSTTPRTVNTALQQAAQKVEQRFAVTIDVVHVGDTALSRPGQELIAAASEAMTNAAKHAPGSIHVFSESSAERIDIFVRDRGTGFDLEELPQDRKGIRHSIQRRVQQAGGTVQIRSSNTGTEVQLMLPLV